jgi:predicted ester cyclase
MIDVLFADSGAASYPYFVKSEERLAGREEFKRFYRRVREQFEEIHVEIDEISPKSDQVVAACVVRAKSRPGVLGPESQTVETRSLCLYRIVGDRIAEIWNNVELDEPELAPFRLDFASN